jgi:ADP-ribose pyrophosphatase
MEMKASEYVDNKGETKFWTFMERPKQVNAVAIAGVIQGRYDAPGDKIVLIKQFRIPLNDYIWELPAGLVDENETKDQTAKREFKEETGLTLKYITSIIPFGYNSAGISTEQTAIVCGLVEGIVSKDQHESSEDIEIHILLKGEVAELLNDVTKGTSKMDIKTNLILRMFLNGNLTTYIP